MIDENIKEKVINDLVNGVKVTDIAKKYNITRPSIYRIQNEVRGGVKEKKEDIIEVREEVINNRKRMGNNKYYTFICYLSDESYNDNIVINDVKEKVREKLQNINNICAILHDKDIDKNGIIKKSHYHVILYYPQGIQYNIHTLYR